MVSSKIQIIVKVKVVLWSRPVTKGWLPGPFLAHATSCLQVSWKSVLRKDKQTRKQTIRAETISFLVAVTNKARTHGTGEHIRIVNQWKYRKL